MTDANVLVCVEGFSSICSGCILLRALGVSVGSALVGFSVSNGTFVQDNENNCICAPFILSDKRLKFSVPLSWNTNIKGYKLVEVVPGEPLLFNAILGLVPALSNVYPQKGTFCNFFKDKYMIIDEVGHQIECACPIPSFGLSPSDSNAVLQKLYLTVQDIQLSAVSASHYLISHVTIFQLIFNCNYKHSGYDGALF